MASEFRAYTIVILMMAGVSASGTDEISLNTGIVGSNSSTGLDNPVAVVRIRQVSNLLQAIADTPRDETYVRQSLEGSDVALEDLLRLQIIQRKSPGFSLGFSYFTLEDHTLLLNRLKPHVDLFVEAYIDRWSDFDRIFASYDVQSVPKNMLAYAVIGAFSLDWNGLDITAERGLRVVAKEQANGNRFVMWAQEGNPQASLKEIYWGSHNEIINNVRFVTFGDHDVRKRWGLPDLIWRIQSAVYRIEDAPPQIGATASEALLPYYRDGALQDVGRILIAARNGATSADEIGTSTGISRPRTAALLRLLVELQYFKLQGQSYYLIIPVLDTQDGPMLLEALALSDQILDDWLLANYEQVRADLSGLTALRHGVPYGELFTQIWHYIFGLVNRELASKGYFYDPYDKDRQFGGFLPFAFTVDIYDDSRDETNQAVAAFPRDRR